MQQGIAAQVAGEEEFWRRNQGRSNQITRCNLQALYELHGKQVSLLYGVRCNQELHQPETNWWWIISLLHKTFQVGKEDHGDTNWWQTRATKIGQAGPQVDGNLGSGRFNNWSLKREQGTCVQEVYDIPIFGNVDRTKYGTLYPDWRLNIPLDWINTHKLWKRQLTYCPTTSSIKPIMTIRRRDCKGTVIIIISNVKLIANRGMMRAIIPHYCLLKWKTGATAVVARLTKALSVRRRTALHVWGGRSIRLPNSKEFSRCSSKWDKLDQYMDRNKHLLLHQQAPEHRQPENH